MRLFQIAAWLVLVGPAAAQTQTAHLVYENGVALPDPAATPGVIRTTSKDEVCDRKFRTERFRDITKSKSRLKKICVAYGLKRCPKRGKGEMDDRVPVELGGANVEENVYPQPPDSGDVPGYQTKDKFENYERHHVCIEGDVLLEDAQQVFVTDWFAEYERLKQSSQLP